MDANEKKGRCWGEKQEEVDSVRCAMRYVIQVRVTRRTKRELVVEDSSLWLAAILALASLPLWYVVIVLGKKGSLFGAAFFLLCAFIGLRKSTFVFDADRRLVNWRELRYLKMSSGCIAFDAITDIGIEAASGDAGSTNYRLTILTAQGPIPLSSVYSGGGSEKYASLREQILAFVKHDGAPAAMASAASAEGVANLESSICALLKQGRKIDAIRLLRSTSNMGLTEATRRVTEIEEEVGSGEISSH